MTQIEAIKQRRSVRSFDANKLTAEDIQKLKDFLPEATNPYGIPIEYKLLDAKEHGLSSPVITGTDTYIAGKLARVPHAEEAFGYSFERIVLYAWSIGIGTTWIAGTMNRKAFENAMTLSDNEVMPCVSPLGYEAKKMSFRETMMRKGVKADSRMAFEELFYDNDFETPLSKEKAGDLALPLKLVRLAPSAVNKQPWRIVVRDGLLHFYEKKSKGYETADGWDLQKIDIGIAMCHFALGASECGFKAGFSVNDPGLALPENVAYIASCALTEA